MRARDRFLVDRAVSFFCNIGLIEDVDQGKKKTRLGIDGSSSLFLAASPLGVQRKLPLVSQAPDFVGCHPSALNTEEEENNGAD